MKKPETANADNFAIKGLTPIISAAISISLIAIHFLPTEPLVIFLANTAQKVTKIRHTIYLAQASVAGPVTTIPKTVRSGEPIIPVIL